VGTTALNISVSAGDLLRVAVIKTSGVGASTFDDQAALIEYNDA
jgi:hypothetical protein